MKRNLLQVISLLLFIGLSNSCSDDSENELNIIGRWYLGYFTGAEMSNYLPCLHDTYIELYIDGTGIIKDGCSNNKESVSWNIENNFIEFGGSEKLTTLIKTEIVSMDEDLLLIHAHYSNRELHVYEYKSRK